MARGDEIQKLRVQTALAAKARTDKHALDTVLKGIHKEFGEDSVNLFLSGSKDRITVPCVPLWDQTMNDLLTGATHQVDDRVVPVDGSGRGLPRGRIVEVYGPESSGKTTWTLMVIAAYQAQSLRCAFVDVEHAFDPEYAVRCGVSLEHLLVSQPSSAEEALNITRTFASTGAVDLVVVDSVAALTAQAEQDGDIGDSHVGLQARLMSQALRVITSTLGRGSPTTVVFVNQTRAKIQTGWMAGKGNPETTSGGNALRFYASIRLRCVKIGEVKKGSTVIGQRSALKTVKNKLATPFRTIFMDITEGKGITAVHGKLKR